MKHLHTQFILASIALGFSGVFLFGAMWNVHAMPLNEWTPIRAYLSAMLSSLIGLVLLMFGLSGIRCELQDTTISTHQPRLAYGQPGKRKRKSRA